MTTEASPLEPRGGGEACVPPDEFAEEAGGPLFIRDLPETGTRRPDAVSLAADEDEDGEEEPDDKNVMTTLALGEEGRGEEKAGRKGRVTTLALGEEGERSL